jgi:TolB-like protein
MHLGDVMEEADGDLLGDGVNTAARLEGIAEPDGICVSNAAYEQVRDKFTADFVDLGECDLNNVGQRITAYPIPPPSKKDTTMEPENKGADQGGPPRLSIVVLPFANIGDPEQEYFVDGVTENLTKDLSRISGAFVIARNTAFTYKGRPIDVKQVGRELNVRYALEGSVEQDGSRLEVNVQLIDAESGARLWTERFDKPAADLFDMQAEIVASLVGQLGTQLVTAEAMRSERSSNPDSMDLYFQGRASANKGMTPEYLSQAREYLRRALEIDPDNAHALVAMADVDFFGAAGYVTDDRAARFADAESAVARALSLSRDNAAAHYLLGAIYIFSNRCAQGVDECARALVLDPNLAAAHGLIGFGKIVLGRAEETERHVREALRLSPCDPQAYIWMLFASNAMTWAGRDAEAGAWIQRAIQTNPHWAMLYFYLGATLTNMGRLDEARAAVRTGLGIDPKFTLRRYRDGAPSNDPAYLARRERLVVGMREAGVPEE